ncbi:MAG: rane-bound lytic murein transglycosylase [Acidimicrobiales bacterium]|nr:rane-bound lytic murein transglycosylase [Acidimicrobiales bacterium]
MKGPGGGAGWRRPIGSAAVVALLAVSALAGRPALATPTGATAPQTGAGPTDRNQSAPVPKLADAILIGADGIDAVLDEVEVETTPAVRRSEDQLIDAQLAQADAARLLTEADRARADLVTKALTANTAVRQAQGALERSAAEVARRKLVLAARQKVTDRRRASLDKEQALLRELAVAMFTSKPRDELVGLGSYDQLFTSVRRDALRGIVADDQSAVVVAAEQLWRTARQASRAEQRRVDRAEADRKAHVAELREATKLQDNLGLLLQAADKRVAARTAAFDRASDVQHEALVGRRIARLTADVEGVDLTLVTLHAYWRASAVAPCWIPWWVLAGVGRVESRHGTAQRSTVGADGTTSVRILGIPLDGRPGVAAVGDSDGGRFDGSASVDRAVGPMQFIPSTWVRWATDANGDELSDPHNLYDAAGAAANYLCFGRGPLLDDPAIRVSLLSYNRSVPYGTAVLGYAHGYQEAMELPDIPPPEAGRSLEELGSPEPEG